MLGSFTPKNLVYRQAIGFGSLVRGVLGNVLREDYGSLFRKSANYGTKKFYNICTCSHQGEG